MKISLFLLLCFLAFGFKSQIYAADTLNLSIAEAEKIFIEKNAYLLSQKFYIDEVKANIITAKLWENPGFHFEINAYNPDTKRILDPTSKGQQLIVVNQLFYMAGKRNKRVSLANINKEIAEYQFYDLLRTLRFTLRNTFTDLYYDQQCLKFYLNEIPIIERTVGLYEAQFNKGNLSLKEVVRLKSLLFSLHNEKLKIVNDIYDNQRELNILLQTDNNIYINPKIDVKKFDSIDVSKSKIAILIDSARLKRFDLKVYQSQMDYADMDYKYQKALAVPDPTIGVLADRRSNYIPGYFGPNLDIPLPVWNRNQGNIQAAKIRIKENQLQYSYYEKTVQEEIIQSYVKALETDKLYRTFDQKFTSDFDLLIDGVVVNFEKRNISMIEFIDLYESYKSTTLQKFNLENDRLNSIEEINYKTGSEIFKW